MASQAIVRFQNRYNIRYKPLEIDLPVAVPAKAYLGVDASVGVLHLPDPPESIQHGMVEVEDGIARRNHGVATGVAAGDVVARGVDSPVVGITGIRSRRQ